ncbi:hypothetical protein K1719_041952 [Acacia pycnantha]|nr:hypothetical protein K1719_041952 [Acacia pycnantha]
MVGRMVLIKHLSYLARKYFEEINQDTGKYVFGVDDTLKALKMGAIESLIIWESLDINRYVLRNTSTGEIVIKHLNKERGADESQFRDSTTSLHLVERNFKESCYTSKISKHVLAI